MNANQKREITGRKVFFVFAACFGVIFAVNMGLLYAALGSWPGLEAKNTYVESLSFDQRQKAQAALNWVADVTYDNGDIVVHMRGVSGKLVHLQSLNGKVGLATRDGEDQLLEFGIFPDSFRAEVALGPGNWQVWLSAIGLEGESFRQRLSLIVR